MSQRKPKAAIFDLDGTLLDSMGVWLWVDQEFLLRRGIEMPSDYSAIIAPIGFPAAAQYTKERFSLPETEEEIMAEWRSMAISAYEHDVMAKPDAIAYLKHLIQKGVPIAAATASRPEFYVPALKRLCMYELFSSITEIAEVKHGKGHPDVYLRAAEKLGVSPTECAVFEDIYTGVKAAKEGGFITVAVYDKHHTDTKESKAIADYHINAYIELLENDIFE